MAGFHLFESMLWEPGHGVFLLERHLARLAASATHFGFALDLPDLGARLERFARALPDVPRKLRLELEADGSSRFEHVDVKPSDPIRVRRAPAPVDSADEYLRHKTSRREVYEAALRACPGFADVLLWNERGELTETCAGNVVVERGGRRVTPPGACGLLPGTFRAELLARGELEQEIVPIESLGGADRLWFVNSVRRWCPIEYVAP